MTETASAIDMATAAAAAAADETRITAPEKDTTKAMGTTIREAREDTDTNHPLLYLEVHWFVGGYRILKFLHLHHLPFTPRVRKVLQQAVARQLTGEICSNRFCKPTITRSLVLHSNYGSHCHNISEHAVPNPTQPQLDSSFFASVTDAPTVCPHGA